MAGETTITVIGNLTADPELRFTPAGAAVANFTVASTPRTFDRQTNEWKDGEALFLRCNIWREAAENVAESLTKGARVIGTVGSPAKAALAKQHGLDEAILYREQDFVSAVQELTDGRGVDYAIDGIGGQTLLQTLGAVRPFGMIASVGQVGGDPGPLDLSSLGPARSVALSRPGVLRFMSDTARYREGVLATFQHLQSGLKPHIGAELPLHQAAEAHRRLEAGETSGSILLRP